MKDKMIRTAFITLFLASAITVYAQQVRSPDTNDDGFFGPGSGPDQGQRQGMMFFRFDSRSDGRMMGGYGMLAGYFNPDMADIAEAYKVKIERVFLDAKESRLGLDKKRRDLFIKLHDQAERYRTDKSASKDIISAIKDLNGVQKQIMDINDKAMEKIQALSRDREKEFRAANEAWIKKIETDDKELAKYLDFVTTAGQRPGPGMMNIIKDNPPPKD
jgi:hypothetical protein